MKSLSAALVTLACISSAFAAPPVVVSLSGTPSASSSSIASTSTVVVTSSVPSSIASSSAASSTSASATASGSAPVPSPTATGPVQGGASINDTTVMQFALTLERAENALYSGALAQFGADAFTKAGFPDWVRGRFVQIGNHEKSHITFLTAALEAAGAQVPEPCNYTFPLTDPLSLVMLSKAVESVGGAAYSGALTVLSEPGNIQAAAAIMAIEQRQSGWVNAAVLKHAGWDGDFETAIPPSGAFSLAQAFFVDCPSTNPALPITFFPALNITKTPTSPGDQISVAFEGASFTNNSTFLAFISGLNTTFVSLDSKGSARTPEGLRGTVFVGAVNSNNGTVDDTTMVSGFGLLNFEFNSFARGNA